MALPTSLKATHWQHLEFQSTTVSDDPHRAIISLYLGASLKRFECCRAEIDMVSTTRPLKQRQCRETRLWTFTIHKLGPFDMRSQSAGHVYDKESSVAV